MKNYAKGKKLLVINGIEISTVDGHIIGIGLNEGIDSQINRKKLGVLEACDLIRDFNGEVYIPHPFDIQKKGLGVNMIDIDGIVEVFNPMNIFGFENKFAEELASKLEKPSAVGADAHSHTSLDRCLTCVDTTLEEESVLIALRKGQSTFEKCRYMTLEEMKCWILQRMQFSYSSIRKKVQNGWGLETWHMKIANNWLLRKFKKCSLEMGVREPECFAWDLITYFSYSITILKARNTRKKYSFSLK